MQFQIRFYGRLHELAQTRTMTIEALSAPTVSEAIVMVVTKYPALLKSLDRVAYCLGDDIVSRDDQLIPGVELGFLPPVSGG